jgi:hypothetical protein
MVINHVNDNHFKGLNIFNSDYLFTYFYYRQANADVSHPLSFLKPACQVCYPPVILFSYYTRYKWRFHTIESAYNRRRILIILARQYRLAMG